MVKHKFLTAAFVFLWFLFLFMGAEAGYMKASFSYSLNGTPQTMDSVRAYFLFSPPDSSAWLALGSVKMTGPDTVPGNPGMPYVYVKTFSTSWTDSVGFLKVWYRGHKGSQTLFAEEPIADSRSAKSAFAKVINDSSVARTGTTKGWDIRYLHIRGTTGNDTALIATGYGNGHGGFFGAPITGSGIGLFARAQYYGLYGYATAASGTSAGIAGVGGMNGIYGEGRDYGFHGLGHSYNGHGFYMESDSGDALQMTASIHCDTCSNKHALETQGGHGPGGDAIRVLGHGLNGDGIDISSDSAEDIYIRIAPLAAAHYGITTDSLTRLIHGSIVGSIASVTGTVGSVIGSVGSVTGAVGSVTGNVGGNVTGSVGSVATGVTVTTNNDKTGYRLSATGVDDIWDEVVTAHNIAHTFGLFLDTNIASRSSGTMASNWSDTQRDSILAAITNAALIAKIWGVPFSYSFPAGSMGDSINNQSYVQGPAGSQTWSAAQRDTIIAQMRRALDSLNLAYAEAVAAKDTAHASNLSALLARDSAHAAVVVAILARDSAHAAVMWALAARDSAHLAIVAAAAARDSAHQAVLAAVRTKDSVLILSGMGKGSKVLSRYHNAADTLFFVTSAGDTARYEVYHHPADTTSGGRPDSTKSH